MLRNQQANQPAVPSENQASFQENRLDSGGGVGGKCAGGPTGFAVLRSPLITLHFNVTVVKELGAIGL